MCEQFRHAEPAPPQAPFRRLGRADGSARQPALIRWRRRPKWHSTELSLSWSCKKRILLDTSRRRALLKYVTGILLSWYAQVWGNNARAVPDGGDQIVAHLSK